MAAESSVAHIARSAATVQVQYRRRCLNAIMTCHGSSTVVKGSRVIYHSDMVPLAVVHPQERLLRGLDFVGKPCSQ